MKTKIQKSFIFFAATLLIILALPFFTLLVDPDSTLVVRDILRSFLPSKSVWLIGMKEGFFPPQWNPFLVGGTPYWADLGQGSFHPLNLVFLLIPKLHLAFSWFVFLHFPIAAWGMNLLLKEYKLSDPIRWIFSAAYCLGGVFFSLNNVPNLLGAATILPFFFAFWHRWNHQDKLFSSQSFILSICLAGNLIVGAPEFSYFLGLFLLFTIPSLKKNNFLKLGILFVSSLLCSAMQLLPGILQLLSSRRGLSKLSLEEAQWLSFHPMRILEFISPLPFGNYSSAGNYWGSQYVNGPLKMPLVFSCFFGITLLWGIFPTLYSGKSKRNIFYSVIAIVFVFLLSMGPNAPINLNGFFFQNFPLWNIFRYPEKFLIFLHILLVLLAAIGWQKIAVGSVGLWKKWTAISTAFTIVIMLFSSSLHPGEGPVNQMAYLSPMIGLVAAILATFLFSSSKLRNFGFLLLGIAIIYPLIWHDHSILWPQKVSLLQNSTPKKILLDTKANQLKVQHGRASRIASFTADAERLMITPIPPDNLDIVGKISWAYYSNLSTAINSLHQLSHIGGHGMMDSSDRELFWKNLSGVNPNRLLNLLGAYYIISPPTEKFGASRIGLNISAVPYVMAADQIQFFSSFDSVLERLREPTFNEQSELLIETPSPENAAKGTPAIISVERKALGKIELSIKPLNSGSIWIQVGESYDPFWKAKLKDGTKLEIHRANGWAMAFRLNGPAEVLLSYQNPIAWIGLVISFAYFFVLFLFRKKLF